MNLDKITLGELLAHPIKDVRRHAIGCLKALQYQEEKTDDEVRMDYFGITPHGFNAAEHPHYCRDCRKENITCESCGLCWNCHQKLA